MTHDEFKRRFMPLQRVLYREAFKVLGDSFEAEDAVQNLYVRLWEQKEQLDRLVSPEAYCRTVLRNICIDRWRAIRARDEDVVITENTVDMNAPPDIEHGEAKEFIEHFIVNLPKLQQRVIRMQMSGKGADEIAEVTGLTTGNVKVIVSRIRSRFKELYYKR